MMSNQHVSKQSSIKEENNKSNIGALHSTNSGNSTSNNTSTNSSNSSFYEIKTGPKGRGLFATRDIPTFTLIHSAPCILIPNQEYEQHMKFTILEHYLFNCKQSVSSSSTSSALSSSNTNTNNINNTNGGYDRLLALGHGSLFNHDSNNANIIYQLDTPNLMIHYSTSYKPIKEGDELCIYYGHKLWFDDVDDRQTSNGTDDNTDDNDSGSKNDGENMNSDEETEENGMVAFMNQMQL